MKFNSINHSFSSTEDSFPDIITKATRGKGWSDFQLMEHSGLSMLEIAAAKEGEFDNKTALSLAEVLELDPDALTAMGCGKHNLQPHRPEGWICFTAPCPNVSFPEMTVNSYLFACPETKSAALVDAGGPAKDVAQVLKHNSWSLDLILLTHSHSDHLQDLGKLKQLNPNMRVLAPLGEVPAGAVGFYPEDNFSVGTLTIRSIPTPGHSPNGTSYSVDGLTQKVLCVGDAIFARSVGKIPPACYAETIKTLQALLRSLAPDTLLAPGHGPLTSVAEELELNPFLADAKKH